MRISNFLIESVATDVFKGEFETFISDYNVIYSKNLFVGFSDSEDFNIDDLPTDTSTGIPLLFPLDHVVSEPAMYTEYAEYAYLHVLESNNIFDISKAKLSNVKELSKIQGLSKEQFDMILVKFSDNYKTNNPSIESYMFSKLLFNDVTITDDEMKLKRVSNDVVKKRLKKMGASTITQTQPHGYLLSKEHKIVSYGFNSNSLNSKDKYVLSTKKENNIEGELNSNSKLYFRDKDYMRTVAEKVAQGLGTTLNSDPSYSLFLDYYFWTKDGIELVITVGFSDSEITATHDDVYYVVEADTPYGIMVHRINADKNLDHISSEIKRVYTSHVTPNDSWEPQNRDLFLDEERREYKLFDAHYDDISKIVDEYYPRVYNLARTYNIALPVLSYYGSFDKIYLHQFIEFLASNPTPAVKLLKELEDKGYDFDDLFYVPMPKKITVDILKSISLIYSEMKKRKPAASGWYLFKDK